MVKEKITIENFRQFKPSDLIAQSINDIDLMQGIGVDIKMNNWYGAGLYSGTCCACLGGAVVAGLEPKLMDALKRRDTSTCLQILCNSTELYGVAKLFDCIRSNAIHGVADYICCLYDINNKDQQQKLINSLLTNWVGKYFHGYIQGEEILKLKLSIQRLVDALRSVDL